MAESLQASSPQSREQQTDNTLPLPSWHLPANRAIEYFGDKAIIFLAERDTLLTVNAGAAHLVEAIRETFAERNFSLREFTHLMESRYDIASAEALKEAREALSFFLRMSILLDDTDHP
jgi:hypothetical protein